MKLGKSLIATAIVGALTGTAFAETVVVEYSNGVKYSGSMYTDRAGHYFLIDSDSVHHRINWRRVAYCTGTSCPPDIKKPPKNRPKQVTEEPKAPEPEQPNKLVIKPAKKLDLGPQTAQPKTAEKTVVKTAEKVAKKTKTAEKAEKKVQETVAKKQADKPVEKPAEKPADSPKTTTPATVTVADTTIGVFGSNTIGAELLPNLIKAHAKTQNHSVRIKDGQEHEQRILTVSDSAAKPLLAFDLHARGSGTAFPALASGQAELGMASRPIKDKEQAALAKQNINDMRGRGQEHVLALDGLVVIVAADNPIKQLSLKQIADLFAGKITNWSQLGGADQAVTIYARDDKSGTYDTFKSLVLKPSKAKLNGKAQRFESNSELSAAVAKDAGAIGFTGFAYIGNSKAVALTSDCGIVSEPTVFKMKTEEYPLTRRLYLYNTQELLSDPAKALLDYALSDEAQTVINNVGFVDQGISGKAFTADSPRIAKVKKEKGVPKKLINQFAQQLAGAERLATTFRFETGSFEPDIKAQQDIDRIATWIANNTDDKRTVYLVGFADSVGRFDTNLRLAKRRAEQIAGRLEKRLPESGLARIKVLSYGEMAPVACNTSDLGKSKNRRVEVWVE